MVKSIDTYILSWFSCRVGGKAAIGRRRRVLPILRYYIENSLRKLLKTVDRDATVGSQDTHLLTRYSGSFGGMAPTGRHRCVVPDSTLLHRKQPPETREKNLSAIQRSDLEIPTY